LSVDEFARKLDLGRDVFELNDSRKRAMYFFILKFRGALEQGRRRIDNWGGGLIFVYSCLQTVKTIDFKRSE
jgi:hypothetical protein